jgi:branched-chain amino acid transport system permease protein
MDRGDASVAPRAPRPPEPDPPAPRPATPAPGGLGLLRGSLPFLLGVPVLLLAQLLLPGKGESYLIYVAGLVGINAVLAVSLNVVNGFTGQFSLGQAGFMAVGGYVAAAITVFVGGTWQLAGVPVAVSDELFFVAAMVAGGLAAGIAGLLVGIPSLRLRGDYLAIVTLGFGEILRNVLENLRAMGGAAGFPGVPPRANLFWIGFWVLSALVVSRRLLVSRHGRALLAIREDEVAAQATGVDTTAYKVRAFALSAFYAGVAGALLGHYLQILSPRDFTWVKSIEIVAMIVLGGLGSISGAVVGAVVITVLPEALRPLQEWTGVDFRMVIFALLLVGLMLLRPQGLFGHRELWSPGRLGRREERAGLPPGISGEGEPPAPAIRDAAVASRAAPARAEAGEFVLEARNVGVRFGGLAALTDFSLALAPRELVGLIGPNGAGKTTAFNVLTGVYRPSSGEVRAGGVVVNRYRPHRIVALGVARTFQNIRLFGGLSVLDNVRVGFHPGARASWPGALLRTRASLREEADIQRMARHLLDVLGLGGRAETLARNLPYGEQRRLEIARALATAPRCLLLDEPAAGMNAAEKVELLALIRRLREEFGVAILLIEHDMRLVMGVCERLLVLDHGVTIARGTPEEVRRNPAVIAAYLGEGEEAGR